MVHTLQMSLPTGPATAFRISGEHVAAHVFVLHLIWVSVAVDFVNPSNVPPALTRCCRQQSLPYGAVCPHVATPKDFGNLRDQWSITLCRSSSHFQKSACLRWIGKPVEIRQYPHPLVDFATRVASSAKHRGRFVPKIVSATSRRPRYAASPAFVRREVRETEVPTKYPILSTGLLESS